MKIRSDRLFYAGLVLVLCAVAACLIVAMAYAWGAS